MKKAIIIASFGTTHMDAIENCVKRLEDHVRDEFPGCKVVSAFTSGIVRERLKQRGVIVFSPEETIKSLANDGFGTAYILPTHLLPGYEYEKLEEVLGGFLWMNIRLADPLLNGDENFEAILNAIEEILPKEKDQGLVLIGHGSGHPSNELYSKMNTYIRSKGINAFVATVEAEPGLNEAIARMRELNIDRITLAPLLFVAGNHAKNDMAGGDESWLNAFKKEGFKAEALVKGLGEYPKIREMYCSNLKKIFM